MKQSVLLLTLTLSLIATTAQASFASATLAETKDAAGTPASSDYVWEIDMGNGRIERGLSRTFKMSELGMEALHPSMGCHSDETLVNGGCSAIYGVTMQGSMPLTLRSKPNEHKWICNFAADLGSALGLDGNKPVANLPADQLKGATYLILTCEKNAAQKQ